MNGGRALSAAIVVGVMLAVAHPAGAAATRETAEATVPDLPNPPEIRSRHGVLDAVFLTEPGKVTVATERFTSNVYNDLYIPPTLRVRRGDTLLLRLVNRIGPADVEITQKQPTNIHFHGMDVSPKRPGDNVFINVSPGKSFQYRVEIPKDHPQGLHWYHSHLHEFVDPQILSGLSGMLIVDGGSRATIPSSPTFGSGSWCSRTSTCPAAAPRRGPSMAWPTRRSAAALASSRSGRSAIWAPTASSTSGWRGTGSGCWSATATSCAGRGCRIRLFLPPGARTLVVVEAGAPGRYYFQTKDVDTGPTGLPSPRARLGTFVVEGPPVNGGALAERLERPAANIEAIGLTGEELRNMPIARRRTFTFSDAPDFSAFFINHKTYVESRIDTRVRLGHVEEWTIRNAAGELHVFHIHQTSFLVKEVNGVNQDYPGLRDVINVPWQIGSTPGEVKLIIPFLNPLMVGKFVYHCHIVGHEDAGMMQNIEVFRPRSTRGGTLGSGSRSGQRPAAGVVGQSRGPGQCCRAAGLAADDAAICRSPSARERAQIATR